MTKSEYADYEARVARGVEGLTFISTGACPGCEDCGLPKEPSEHERACAEEPHFSWRACDCCGSALGGDRHPAHGWRGDSLEHLSVCTDCLYYLNYGRLDDTTMLEVEASA